MCRRRLTSSGPSGFRPPMLTFNKCRCFTTRTMLSPPSSLKRPYSAICRICFCAPMMSYVNGKGNPPFKGGPPYTTNKDSLDETQWVPYYVANVHPNPQKEKDEAGKNIQIDQEEGKQWAQIGKIPEGKGGAEENSYGLCWDYNEWSNYDAVSIEDVWSEETRVWMLCCSDPADEEEKELTVG